MPEFLYSGQGIPADTDVHACGQVVRAGLLPMAENRDKLTRADIKKLTPKAQVALAARCALRVLPLIGREGHFDFWPEEKRAFYMEAVEAATYAAADVASSSSSSAYARAAASRTAARAAASAADAAYGAYACAAADDDYNELRVFSQTNAEKKVCPSRWRSLIARFGRMTNLVNGRSFCKTGNGRSQYVV